MKPRYSFSSRRTGHLKNLRKQKTKFTDAVQKLLQEADIILEVLDARFPEETRNYEIEEEIKVQRKKIVYILNKSDLISSKKIKKFNYIAPNISVSCKKRKGVKKLRDKLKIIALKLKKEKVVVGVIGYPNTGKSSLINILIGSSSAGTGADAGFTKGIQKLKLSSNILLIDSPGVIPKQEYSSANQKQLTKHAKLGARSYSQLKEPEIIVAELMQEFPNVFEKFYKIDAEGDSEILIEGLGRKKGFIKKGNEVDEDKTSRVILRDWQTGKIRINRKNPSGF